MTLAASRENMNAKGVAHADECEKGDFIWFVLN